MINTDHLHPLIVHFPIAIIIVGFAAEVVSLFFRKEKCLSKTGFYLMVIGSLAAIAAWSTEILSVYEKHATGGLITMILIVVGTMFRIWLVIKKKEDSSMKWIAFGFYLLAFAAVSFTGFMGGNMVYDFMIGQ
jgi:uncharacterized membrane protein